jgi:hypothetical protein
MTFDYETVEAVNECLPILHQYYRVRDLGNKIVSSVSPRTYVGDDHVRLYDYWLNEVWKHENP